MNQINNVKTCLILDERWRSSW